MLFVVMVDVNPEHLDRVVEPPVTALCHKDWIILFVVKGRANMVYAMIIVIKTVTVFQDYIVLVLLILRNVVLMIRAEERQHHRQHRQFLWHHRKHQQRHHR